MFFLYTLFALAAVATLIFAVPLRAKAWAATAVVGLGALAASAAAVGVLAGKAGLSLWSMPGTLFGGDSGSMDRLSALFVLLVSIGSVASVLYARGYLEHTLREKSPAHVSLHYTALTVMSLAMLGVVTSDGGYSFLFFWELMTVASFLLILYDAERREVRRAALAYLIMMHVGFVLLVVGFVTLDSTCGAATFGALAEYFRTQPALPLLLVFLAGFGMKAGMFPLHVWLPEAHPAAPSHVSALMSGVMIKTGVYGILRVVAALGDLPVLRTAGYLLLALGIITGVWGVILAALQNDIKRLLAYSSIENVGIIFIAIGVALLGRSAGNDAVALCGMAGALLHTLNHSFFKSLLFFGAGNLYAETHTTALDRFGGVARQMPVTAILFLAGTAAICALPPLNGFVSEFIIYTGMFRSIAEGQQVLLAAAGVTALALIGGLALFAFTKLYGIVFLGAPRTHEVAEMHEADNYRIAAMALPAAGILFIGLLPWTVLPLLTKVAATLLPGLGAGRQPAAELPLWAGLTQITLVAAVLIAATALLLVAKRRALRRRTVASGPTWGCGFTAVNTRMQYTGESFVEGLESIVHPFTEEVVEGKAVDKQEIFPSAHDFDIRRKDRVARLFSAWWVESLRLLNARVMRLRTGKINHYILFALLFIVLVFLCSILNLL